jgi:RNA polymerase sigma-70 factor (ECF subfamily)
VSRDAALVQACLKGEEGAWAALVDRHGAYLRRLILHRLGRIPGADPDAVFQDLWVALLEDGSRRLRRYDPARLLAPYLAAIALNLCRDHLRQRRPGALAGEAGFDPVDPAVGPASRSDRREEAARGQAALAGLSARERAAFALVELEGLSYAEAGRVLGLAEGSVGSLLTRARERLRKSLDA